MQKENASDMTEPDTVLRTAVMQWLNELPPEDRQAIITEINTPEKNT